MKQRIAPGSHLLDRSVAGSTALLEQPSLMPVSLKGSKEKRRRQARRESCRSPFAKRTTESHSTLDTINLADEAAIEAALKKLELGDDFHFDLRMPGEHGKEDAFTMKI